MEFNRDIGADPTKKRIREQNYLPYRPLNQEILEVLDLVSFRHGYSPRVCSFKIIEQCNFDCSHCDANKVFGRRLSLGKILNVLNNLKQAGIQTVDLTGGEPTLRKDLIQIVAYASKLGLRPTLNTNGGIEKSGEEEEDYWKKMAEAGLQGVHFSYDGMYPKNDPRVIARAHYLLETLHIYGGVRTVVTQDNLDKVYNIGELCLLNSIFFQPVPAVALGGESSASSGDFHPLDKTGWKEFVKINQRLAAVRGPFAKFLRMPSDYLKDVASAPNPNTAWHCKDPSAHWISVDAHGNVRVCNDVALLGEYSLTGEENPLLAREFHKAVTKASEECGGCSWLCHWIGNRKQVSRTKDEWRFYVTAASLT